MTYDELEQQINNHSPSELMLGNESFEDKNLRETYLASLQTNAWVMDKAVVSKQDENTPIIRTSDNKNFRVYVMARSTFSSTYTRKLSQFLLTRTETDTVTFLLGTKSYDGAAHSIGPILSAMQQTKANIITKAMGYCSIPETMIWSYGKEREVMQYGALTFGRTDIVRYEDVFKRYFNTYFAHVKSLGILSDEDAEELMRSGKEFLIMSPDYNKNS